MKDSDILYNNIEKNGRFVLITLIFLSTYLCLSVAKSGQTALKLDPIQEHLGSFWGKS